VGSLPTGSRPACIRLGQHRLLAAPSVLLGPVLSVDVNRIGPAAATVTGYAALGMPA